MDSDVWINNNCPIDGLFRVYWTEKGEATLDPEEGVGLRYEWYYKDGKRADGTSKSWHENGKIKQEYIWKNEGVTLRGDLKEPVGGTVDGTSKWWHPNGQLKQTQNWKNGVKHGVSNSWHKHGQKRSEETYKDGKLVDGLNTVWFDTGTKRFESTYKDGLKNGLENEWHQHAGAKLGERGQKLLEGTWKNGNREGLWTEWYENGQKKSEIIYKDDVEYGKWIKWYKNGQKESEGTYPVSEIGSNDTYGDEIQELLEERNKYTRKLLEKTIQIVLGSSPIHTYWDYADIPRNNKTEKTLLFLKEIRNVKDEFINWGVDNYKRNSFVHDGKGLKYLVCLIKNRSNQK